MRAAALLLLTIAALCWPASGMAQTDEIQVYDAGLAAPGVFNLTWHNNFTPDGIKTPAYPGTVTADKSWNGVPEWAYGLTPWFELGLYLPLYSHDQHLGWGIDGFKLRTLFAVPDADDRRFVYGANFEFSVNRRQWDATHFTSEIRPIVGWHLTGIDVIVNPILDTAYDGLKNLEFVPATRVAVSLGPRWQVAAEEYANFGTVSHLLPASQQSHQLYFVVDRTKAPLEIEAGVGFGLTEASDRLTFKVILATDLTKPRGTRH
jgi:hypothetical protein